MSWVGETWRRVIYRLRGKDFECDLAEEMQLHLDLIAAEKRSAGMSPEAAQLAAKRQFGNRLLLREQSGEAWGWTFLDTLAQDLRYAFRTLRANPYFSSAAILSLALGIGANTAIFSIINAAMLRELPVANPARLVSVSMIGSGIDSFTNPIWEQIRDNQKTFSGMLAFSDARFDLANGGESHFVRGAWVSGDFFRVLGVAPLRGRTFTPDDDRHGGGTDGAVAVISFDFWKRHYSGDADIVGKQISLDRHSFTIVGVTPPWFTGLQVEHPFDVAIPLGCETILNPAHSDLDNRSSFWLQLFGRLPDGVTLPQADAQMKALAPAVYRATLPPDWKPESQKEYLEYSLSVAPASTGISDLGTEYRPALFTLMAIVGLVLLIACGNIANLLLARGLVRRHELSVRLAIGASRRRIIRQLMTESLLLSGIGAMLGLLLAHWGSRLFLRLISTQRTPFEINLAIDSHLLAFNAGVAILTGLLFGLAPAWRSTRIQINQVLKDESPTSLSGSRRIHVSRFLVAGQVALSLVLLVGAGLFLKTFQNLLDVDPGFNRQGLVIVNASTKESAVPAVDQPRLFEVILDRIRAVPGVKSASASGIVPVGRNIWNELSFPEGYTPKASRDTLVYMNDVSPQYFATMGTPVLIGREFTDQDSATAPKVMVITEGTARHFFGSINALGKTIGLESPGHPGEKLFFQVVGVVKDSKYAHLDEAPKKMAFVPWTQYPQDVRPRIYFEVRSSIEGILPALRSTIVGAAPDLALEFNDFDIQIKDSLVQQRVIATLSLTFSLLAFLLSMVGLYGVTAYSVNQRKPEIGIRMALGARPGAVLWLVLREALVLLAIGVTLGWIIAIPSGRWVQSLLFGVQPGSPSHLLGATLMLAIGTAIASVLPARRAASLEPMTVLRRG
jgi:putative ABC transport system permease protein